MLCKNTCGIACLVAAGAVIGAAATSLVVAQPEGEMPSMEEMMKMMAEASAPGERHKALGALVGEWDVDAVFTMPTGEENTSKGSASNQWLLGDRFIGQHYTGNFMGMDFEGFGALAYHKETDAYESVWMDNFGTGIMYQTGKAGEDMKVVTVSGEYTSAMGVQKMKNVTKIISNDKHVMEFWEPAGPNGEYVKTGTLTYTRK